MGLNFPVSLSFKSVLTGGIQVLHLSVGTEVDSFKEIKVYELLLLRLGLWKDMFFMALRMIWDQRFGRPGWITIWNLVTGTKCCDNVASSWIEVAWKASIAAIWDWSSWLYIQILCWSLKALDMGCIVIETRLFWVGKL